MTGRKSAELAHFARSAYEESVAPSMHILQSYIREATKVARELTAAGINGSWIKWEYDWLAHAEGIYPTPYNLDLEAGGVTVEYTVGQGYPDEAFLPFAALDDPKAFFTPLRDKVLAEKAEREQARLEAKRQDLLRQLADLDSGTKRQKLTGEIDALTDYDLNAR